jgi:hypothetical protein
LARECADATLRAEVERMLAEDRSSDGALAAGQGLPPTIPP